VRGKARQHHWMVFGIVYFSVETEQPDGSKVRVHGEAPLNCMVQAQHQYINAKRMGQAQQLLQMRAAQKIADETFKPEDVVLHTFNYLGHMTEEEFRKEEIEATPTQGVPLLD
jgi:AraC-like DNA-binding protein